MRTHGTSAACAHGEDQLRDLLSRVGASWVCSRTLMQMRDGSSTSSLGSTSRTSASAVRKRIAVGTALVGGPPHRSQRAGLPHWAPALGAGGEAYGGPRVHDACRREPSGGQPAYAHPVQAVALAAAP